MASSHSSGRYCPSCGSRLARDNTDTLCALCRKKAQDALRHPPTVPPDFWETEQLKDALASWHMGGIVRAYRHHSHHGPRPLAQELVGGWLGITQAQLSRIEQGRPIKDLDRLIRWAQILHIPSEHLWFRLPGENLGTNNVALSPGFDPVSKPHDRNFGHVIPAQGLGRPVVESQQSGTQGRGSARCLGVVSGYLFKLVREALGLTQAILAEVLALDIVTIQGWENGLKPLTALPAAELVRLKMRLIRLGAPPVIFDALDDALSADMIIAEAVEAGSDLVGQNDHLLGSSVHKRELTNMITWPFTGLAPDRVRCLETLPSNYCGHLGDTFGLDEMERARFFDHLLATAEASICSDAILLRRQAIYLLGFDARSDSAEWLRSEHHRAWHRAYPGNEVPTWVAVRSSALALARFGDRDPVQAFVQQGLTNEQQDVANLNYWAYWVGEIPHLEPDDSFMTATDVSSWDGSALLGHLLNRLEVGSEHADLNVHTLWTLLQARPSLLQGHAALRSLARERIEHLMDDRELSFQARQKLPALAYAIRLTER